VGSSNIGHFGKKGKGKSQPAAKMLHKREGKGGTGNEKHD